MARSETGARRADIRVSALVTVLLLVLTDLALAAWRTTPGRLPAHFSSGYLQRYALRDAARDGLVVLGDSELWGFGVSPEASPVGQLARDLGAAPVENLAYEAQTPINADFVLRFLLAHGVRPRAVLLELNPATFNETSSAYDRLNPALADLALPDLLEPFDAGRLTDAQRRREITPGERLDRFVGDHWRLYGARLDLHQALFGDADLASAIYTRVEPLVQPAPRRGTAAYAAMYDLTPLAADNVSFAYADHLLRTLARNRIPALVVLPPINHALLHPYIDNAAYRANLARLTQLAGRYRFATLNLDGLLAAGDFLDNTHVNADGGARLARAIAPHVARLLDVF